MLTNGKKDGNSQVFMVLGPPGSGKGTQVEMLANKFGFHHFISSKIGRDYIKEHNDPESLEQKQRYERGLLFETKWMFERVKEKVEEALNHSDKYAGIVFDGSPRTLFEAESLFNFLSERIGKENIKVIEIQVSEGELRKRISKRLICSKSASHVYIGSEKLKEGGACPEGDGILKKRDLDKEEIFNRRMEVYKKETIPAIKFLKEKHEVIEVNGEQSIENVHKEIIKKLAL